jgi:hypothetical protein
MTNKKKVTLIGAIVAAIVLIGAIGYGIWAMFLAPPTKQDFTDAKATMDEVVTHRGSVGLNDFYAKTVERARAGDSQDKLIESTKAERDKTLETLEKRHALIDELRGSRILRDQEVKKAFDTFDARETRYSNYIRDYMNAFPPYRSSFITCIKVFQINDNAANNLTVLAGRHRTAAKPCLEDLDALAKSPITPYANYAKEFARIIRERQKVFDGIENKTLAEKPAGDRLQQLANDYSKNDPTDGIKKYGEEAVFTDEIKNFRELIDKKIEQTK